MSTRQVPIVDNSPTDIKITIYRNQPLDVALLGLTPMMYLMMPGDPKSPYIIFDWVRNQHYFAPEDNQRVEVLQGGCE